MPQRPAATAARRASASCATPSCWPQIADLADAPVHRPHHLVRVHIRAPRSTSCSRDHGLAPRRDLGQNFVADPNTVRRIARLAGVGPGDRVVEIGAGARLADPGAGRDRRARSPRSRSTAASCRCCATSRRTGVRVVEGDAHAPRLGRRCSAAPTTGCSSPTCPTTWPRRSSSTCSTACPPIARMLVMVQREVGERLCAAPAHAAYGAVSVKVAYWATAPRRRPRAGHRVRAPAQRRVGARRDRPPRRAGRRRADRDRAVRAGAHRVRSTPQDAPPLARRTSCRPSSSPQPASTPAARPRSSTWTTGARSPALDADGER